MMEHTNLQVCMNSANSPISFIRQGKLHNIRQVFECWRFTGAWWDGESERTYFRVKTDGGGIYELCFEHISSNWKLSRVED